jgi:hypothetical protein
VGKSREGGYSAVVAILAILATLVSGLYGTVTRGPTKPVCMVNQPCSAPYAHATLVFSRSGMTARRVTTDAKGAYRIALPPGRWSLRVQGARFGWTPASALVPRTRYARVGVYVETGIR